jgi:hypothetical protein
VEHSDVLVHLLKHRGIPLFLALFFAFVGLASVGASVRSTVNLEATCVDFRSLLFLSFLKLFLSFFLVQSLLSIFEICKHLCSRWHGALHPGVIHDLLKSQSVKGVKGQHSCDNVYKLLREEFHSTFFAL